MDMNRVFIAIILKRVRKLTLFIQIDNINIIAVIHKKIPFIANFIVFIVFSC